MSAMSNTIERRSGWGRLTQPGDSGTLATIGLVLIAYLGSSFVAPLTPPLMNMYVIQPLLWLLPAALVFRTLGLERAQLWQRSGLLLGALTIGVAQIGGSVIAGLFAGFGRSPYAHTLTAVPATLWYGAALLVGRETARWFIARSLRRRNEFVAVLATTALFWITSLSPNGFQLLAEPRTAFPYLGQQVLPLLIQSLLLTYLALLGGPLTAMAYGGIVLLFEFLSPVLPDLPWALAAVIGVLIPLSGLMLAYPSEEPAAAAMATTADDAAATNEAKGGISFGWVAVAAFGVLIAFFNFGVFGVQPSLVSGVSMEPTMHTGDIVVTRHVSADSLKVGDVIRFRQNGRDVIHRVINIDRSNGSLIFTTQGDNNSAKDQPVSAETVRGLVVVHVAKVGWPAIWFKMALNGIFK